MLFSWVPVTLQPHFLLKRKCGCSETPCTVIFTSYTASNGSSVSKVSLAHVSVKENLRACFGRCGRRIKTVHYMITYFTIFFMEFRVLSFLPLATSGCCFVMAGCGYAKHRKRLCEFLGYCP